MRSLWLTLISAGGLQLAAFSQTTPIHRGRLLSNLDGNEKSITNVHLSASDLTRGTVGSAVLTGSNAYNGSFTGDGSGLTNLNSSLALGSNNWWLATNVPAMDTSHFLTNLDARSWTNWTGIYGNGVGISNLDLTLAFGTNTYLLGGTNYVFVTNLNDTLTGAKSVTNLIQWIINPVNGTGLVGGRLGSGVLWMTLEGQPVYGYSPNGFYLYTNAHFQSSLIATNPANVLAGDGLGLTNLNPPLALGSNHWWLATNVPTSLVQTQIAFVEVTNAPWLTNFDARALTFTNPANYLMARQTDFATNSSSPLQPDFAQMYQLFTTNAAFTMLDPINLDAHLAQTAVVVVTNSSAAMKSITGSPGIFQQGLWNVTNVTVITYFHYGRMFTNAISLPLY